MTMPILYLNRARIYQLTLALSALVILFIVLPKRSPSPNLVCNRFKSHCDQQLESAFPDIFGWSTTDTNRTSLHVDQPASTPSFVKTIQDLFKPLLIPVDSISFQESEFRRSYDITSSHWTASLGSELCIIHVDTRPLNQTNELFSPDFSWSEVEEVSSGLLNHHLYATIHGYRYHFIRSNSYPLDGTTDGLERDNVWKRVPALASVLANGLPPKYDTGLSMGSTLAANNDRCEVVVLIDADAVFQHLELPFEWLMNRWNITPLTSIAMPLDTEWNPEDPNLKLPSGIRIIPKAI